ncbi:MAG TPA: BtpA/SgcQ family protein [Phycisphaerae bacterium]|nr:BtpA/SgcQ family protein [Phycisphaerae bacterium]
MKASTATVPALPDTPIIGMVHLAPLPGSPGNRLRAYPKTRVGPASSRSDFRAFGWALSLHEIIGQAIADARALAEAGFDAVLIENFGDSPFRAVRVDPHTVSAMTVAARAVREAIDLPIGINVLRNDPRAALAVAACCNASFIRVNVHVGVYATDQGIIEGRADETLRYRNRLGTTTAIIADVHVKHARPLSCTDIAEAAEETAYRGRADGLIVSGSATGRPTDLDDLRRVRSAVPDRPVLVGSGATATTIRDILACGCGVIVGTFIKQGGVTTAPVDAGLAKAFVATARS